MLAPLPASYAAIGLRCKQRACAASMSTGPAQVSWHRWTILSMHAHAFLAVLAATE